MASIQIGSLIAGKYRLERLLARGGMGSVWVARQIQLDRPVAIKFMTAAVAHSSDGFARFEREARAAALIQSPQVVQVYDYGIEEEVPYIVMELLSGEDLGQRLRREPRFSPRTTAKILQQIARGLRKAHEAGVVHRDLKPANIFLLSGEEEESVKILDFGIAKMTSANEAGESTRTGDVVGSVHFVSPEQGRGLRQIDHRADLWSLSVIAYRLITGTLPFPGEALGDVLVRICTESAPLPSQVAPDLGTTFDAFFQKALARNPDDRFQSARELSAAFAEIAGTRDDSPSSSLRFEPRLVSASDASRPSSAGFATPIPSSVSSSAGFATPVPSSLSSSGTLKSASHTQDLVLSEASARRAPRAAFWGALAVGVVVVGIGSTVWLTGSDAGSSPSATAAASAPPPVPSSAPAPAASSAEPITIPAQVISASAAPVRRAPPARKPSTRTPPKKVNTTLGF